MDHTLLAAGKRHFHLASLWCWLETGALRPARGIALDSNPANIKRYLLFSALLAWDTVSNEAGFTNGLNDCILYEMQNGIQLLNQV